MSTPHRGAPKLCSNDPDNFIAGGGLYPGGTGIFKEIGYAFWDYNGTRPPNSQVAVKVVFTPTDGSNEGKDETIYWSVGPATEYTPDQTGGFLFATGNSEQMRESCNWHFVASKLRTNCSMPAGFLDTGAGIKQLQGCQVTLVRQDQPERNIERNQTPVIPGAPAKSKPTILVPTHGVFPWSAGGAGAVAGVAPGSAAAKAAAAKAKRGAAAQAAPAPETAQAAAPAPAPAPAMATAPAPAAALAPTPAPVTNGAAPAPAAGSSITDAQLGVIIRDILTAAEGNAVEMKNLPMLLTEKLGPQGLQVTANARIAILKQVKQPEFMAAIAAAQALTYDGEIIAI